MPTRAFEAVHKATKPMQIHFDGIQTRVDDSQETFKFESKVICLWHIQCSMLAEIDVPHQKQMPNRKKRIFAELKLWQVVIIMTDAARQPKFGIVESVMHYAQFIMPSI